MSVDCCPKLQSGNMIFQRKLYTKSIITRKYWDYRDKQVFSFIEPVHLRIVDIGCGEGITLERLAKNFPDRIVLGTDLSEENISICQQYGLPVITSDIYNLKINDNSIDCCLLLDVIEHLCNPERAIREIHRILKTKGRFIVLFPNDLTFKIARVLTCKFKEAFYNHGHVRQWRPNDLAKLLRNNGFRVIFRKNTPFFLWHISLHHFVVADKL